MSDEQRVTCGSHGQTPATFICRHLGTGVACGYHTSSETPDDRWPDAWCDLCDDAYEEAAGWTASSEALAQVGPSCTFCYETARDRNRQVPMHVRGVSTQLTDEELERLVHHAVHEAQAIQDASNRRWSWGQHPRWDFDLAQRTLSFSGPGQSSLVADVDLVGSYSTRSGTFQWAWQTLEPGAAAAAAVSRLRVLGEVRGISPLTTPNLTCEEADASGLVALAAYVLGADGLYRAPFDHVRWFMLMRNWRYMS